MIDGVELGNNYAECKKTLKEAEEELFLSKQKELKSIETENRCVLLGQENERASQSLKGKAKEVEELKKEAGKLRQRVQEQELLLQEHSGAQKQCSELQDAYERLESSVVHERMRVVVLCAEIDRLEDTIASLRDSEAALQARVDDAQRQAATKKDTFHAQLEEEQRRRGDLEGVLAELHNQLDQLEREKASLTKQLKVFREQAAQQEQDLRHYADLKLAHEENALKLKKAVNDVAKAKHDLADAEESRQLQVATLERCLSDAKLKMQTDSDLQSARVSEMENKCALLSSEIERLTAVIKEKQSAVDALTAHYDQLTGNVAHTEAELAELRLVITDHNHWRNHSHALMAIQVILSAELDAMRDTLLQKDQDIKQLRTQLIKENSV